MLSQKCAKMDENIKIGKMLILLEKGIHLGVTIAPTKRL